MSQGPYAGPPQSSGGGGNTLVIVLVIVGVLVLGCVGLCGGCYWLANRALEEGGKQLEKAGAAFGDMASATMLQNQATFSVQQDADVRDKIGSPVGFSPPSITDLNLETGTTSFHFDVNGPNGNGRAVGEGKRDGKEWKITKLQVTFDDGAMIDVEPNASYVPPTDPTIPPTVPDPITPVEPSP